MFPYSRCIDWLRDQTRHLKVAGCNVETIENEIQVPTFALKLTAKTFLADLVVWEYGKASMQVFDIAQEKFVLERHDIDLSGDGFREEMREFFELVSKRFSS